MRWKNRVARWPRTERDLYRAIGILVHKCTFISFDVLQWNIIYFSYHFSLWKFEHWLGVWSQTCRRGEVGVNMAWNVGQAPLKSGRGELLFGRKEHSLTVVHVTRVGLLSSAERQTRPATKPEGSVVLGQKCTKRWTQFFFYRKRMKACTLCVISAGPSNWGSLILLWYMRDCAQRKLV